METSPKKYSLGTKIIAWIIFIELSLITLTWIAKTIIELIDRF